MRSLSRTALEFTYWLAHRMSVEQVSSVGSLIGRTVGGRSRRNARALANIAAALPQTTPAERAVIARQMWDNFGRTVAEAALIDRIAADPARITLINPALLDACGADGRGTVFVGLHFGNWEIMSLPLLRKNLTPMCVYRPLADKEANDLLLQHRSPLCPGGLFPTSRATMLRLARHVRTGGAICIVADHHDSNGLSVPFFGRPAPSVALPAALAVRYGARVIAVRVERLPNARFAVTLERIAIADTGDVDADTLTTTATIQAVFEGWIKADPGRWLWFYKRWSEVDVIPARKQGKSRWWNRVRAVPVLSAHSVTPGSAPTGPALVPALAGSKAG
jgi:KDO2-lipid IV(A) lauroyltransferase